jgi:protein O-mannosyl-transferase
MGLLFFQRKALAAILGFGVLFLLYTPCLRGQFLWDDDAHVTQNQELRSPAGLINIWTKPGSVQQYYPVTYTAFWIEYHLWGLRSTGYHVVNVLFHGLNALLFGLVLSELGIAGAWIAALLFALHPVMVESVAWISELKNVLSGFFYLLSAFFLIRMEKSQSYTLRSYAAALFFFIAALLSKSVTATLPISLFVLAAWTAGHWPMKTFLRLLPFVVSGVIAGLFTLHMESHVIGAQGALWNFSLPERGLIAGRAVGFYLGKLLWPHPLVFIYPRWEISSEKAASLLHPISVLSAGGLLAFGRRWWGKLPFGAFVYFVITLGPVLGFVNIYPMRFSFVADHFQYLASLGFFTIAGWACHHAFKRLHIAPSAPLGTAVVALLLVNIALATHREAQKYSDSLHLWRDTLAWNPASAIAHHNMGIALADDHEWHDALAHFRMAEALDPTLLQPHLALAYFLTHTQDWKNARHEYEEAIRLGESDPRILKDYQATLLTP